MHQTTLGLFSSTFSLCLWLDSLILFTTLKNLFPRASLSVSLPPVNLYALLTLSLLLAAQLYEQCADAALKSPGSLNSMGTL
ncbi:hypothetical protein EWB00_000944 [Schistosoma japonicum]|uniref:Uncharacterized protein n=1 Tax=Schistosoma japonicum TaxID=6182 RepID=A0A4Z2CK65_SCHJA|nr:hypothetical protein EWB00_000944 [Schistosoma japonicum]